MRIFNDFWPFFAKVFDRVSNTYALRMFRKSSIKIENIELRKTTHISVKTSTGNTYIPKANSLKELLRKFFFHISVLSFLYEVTNFFVHM